MKEEQLASQFIFIGKIMLYVFLFFSIKLYFIATDPVFNVLCGTNMIKNVD